MRRRKRKKEKDEHESKRGKREESNGIWRIRRTENRKEREGIDRGS